MIYTKAKITKSIRDILVRNGYKVISMGDNRKLRKGQRAFVDIFAMGGGKLVFFEVKTKDTNDKLSEDQQDTMERLILAMKYNRLVYYAVVDEDNYTDHLARVFEL